jgi:hypothetical protein
MKTYEEIKKSFLENRQNIALGVGYILVFLLGLGVGKYDQEWQKRVARLQNNYNTKSTNLQKETVVQEKGDEEAKVLSEDTNQTCLIKGNISAQGKKIYHIPGGSFYERVKPEECFASEALARAAGFVKSSR